jgi:hypothetical protein
MEQFINFWYQYADTDRELPDLVRLLLLSSLVVLMPAMFLGFVINQMLSCDISLFTAWQIFLLVIGVDLAVLKKFISALYVLGIITAGIAMVSAFIYWGHTDWADLNLIVIFAQFYLGMRYRREDFW